MKFPKEWKCIPTSSSDNDEDDSAIVRSSIDPAHIPGLKVVTEGVEDQENRGCCKYYAATLPRGNKFTRQYRLAHFGIG